jgi:rhamnosyltransferase
MKCSILIRAYNEAEQIGRLFEGISNQTIRETEVILVDSGSRDGTAQIGEEHGAQVVRVSPEDFSFGRSLNVGLNAARCERVVLASAHVHPVYPDWLECLLGALEDEDVALVYGKQRGTQASHLSEKQIFRQWFPDVDVANQAHPFCNNANAAIRRSIWERHKYDETLTGLEDVAWAKWAQAQGYRISYAGRAEVIHVHRETPRRVYERYRREGMAFKHIFPESHFSVYDFVRLTLSNIAMDIREAHRQASLWSDASSVVWFRTLQFWGTYQGYRHSGPITQELRQTFYYPPGLKEQTDSTRGMAPIQYADGER